ncbi:MAG: polysaccharide deacetylase family protein [Planctomycetota bacterium]
MTASPTLLVVVDTEEEFDWFAPFDRSSTSVAHMRDIGAFQSICDAHRIRPVYAVTYPIATQAESIAPLREIHASGRCEIGAHLHPWVTPPLEEEVNARNSYPGNLPRTLEQRKIEALLRAIEDKLGVRPRSYKSGRYGFGPNTAETLAEQGFEVDLSPLPAFDLSSDGGPDWTRASPAPRWLRPGLLTLPATSAFVGLARSAGPALHRLASSPPLSWLRAPSLLSRTRTLERLMLSPEGFLPEHHVRLTRALLDQGVRVFSFTLHSPSIRPGCTPYVRTERDREKFLDACRRYFDFFQGELAGVSMTPLELKRHLESSTPRPVPSPAPA